MATPQVRTPAPVGPSDSSDSASDLIGAPDWRAEAAAAGDTPPALDAGTDAAGTGERAGATESAQAPDGVDIAPDRVVEADEAGLGDGLDQAEEARAGDDSVPPAPGVGDDR